MSEPVQALVVVDMQRGLLAGPQAVVGADALTARVEELIGRATGGRRPGRATAERRRARAGRTSRDSPAGSWG